jgi:hypothetical protein
VFRLAPPVVLWWVWLAFAVVNIADVSLQASPRYALTVDAALITATGLVYALALRPRVIAGPDGVIVRNPFRDHRVPWGSVAGVDVRGWVRVHCAPRPEEPDGRSIDSWALSAPARSRLKAERRAARTRAGARASRLPEEAQRVAALPTVQAIARRLDERASQERRGGAAGGAATAAWAWAPLAGVALPALALLIVVLTGA